MTSQFYLKHQKNTEDSITRPIMKVMKRSTKPPRPFLQLTEQRVTFCAINFLTFNGSCSNIVHITSQMGHVFLPS